jgi:hypothetical protein
MCQWTFKTYLMYSVLFPNIIGAKKSHFKCIKIKRVPLWLNSLEVNRTEQNFLKYFVIHMQTRMQAVVKINGAAFVIRACISSSHSVYLVVV